MFFFAISYENPVAKEKYYAKGQENRSYENPVAYELSKARGRAHVV